MSTEHGTRFEFVLEQSEGASRAVYAATVHTTAGELKARVAITPEGATLLEGGEGLDAEQTRQLVALAKTLGKRADEGPWPRRINRWRQPGVR